MMRRFLNAALAVSIIIAVLPVSAARAEFKGCYERVYDKRYLRKNRKQKIIKMRFQIGLGEGAGDRYELLDQIGAVARGEKIYQSNFVDCAKQGDDLVCRVQDDGGNFSVTDRGGDSLRITNLGFLRFGDKKSDLTVKADRSHTDFRLFKISEGACP